MMKHTFHVFAPLLVAVVLIGGTFSPAGTAFSANHVPGTPIAPTPGTPIAPTPGTPIAPTPAPGTPIAPAPIIPLKNPLNVNSITELLALILEIVIRFSVPVIIFFIIYAGFLYVTAQGKPDQIKKATTAFTWTIIGAVIVLGAQVLLTVIQNTVDALKAKP